ncbi:MAG: histidine kinase [Spirochaetales bacterium]|nr:histidine kinase [Spirochaetales bacterium]
MNLKGKVKLHTILSIFISLILLCIIPGLGKLSLSLFKTRTIESFADSRRDTLFQISSSVSEYCTKIELLSSSYSEIPYIQEQASLLADEIDQTVFQDSISSLKSRIDESFFFPEIEYELQILCMNGLAFSSNPEHIDTLISLPEKLWFYQAMKDESDSIWQSNILFRDDDETTNVISLVKFLKTREGETSGAILINLNERQLYQIYSRIIGFQSTIYLVDQNGQIASHPIVSMVGRFFYDMDIFNSFFREKDWAQIQKSEKEHLFSRFSSDDNPWIVVEEIPLAVITDPLLEISKTINFLTVILFLLSVIVAIFFSRRVSLPFEKLAATMELAGKGDLDLEFQQTGCHESFKMAESSQNFVDRIQSLIQELQRSQQEKQNSELEFLQMQINPHFIYNTLFSIRCMVDIGVSDKASEMLNRFTNMLQKVLRIKSPMITIMDNIDYLEDYSYILAQRFGALSLDYEIESGIEDCLILKFILQPLVENSVFHGFADGFDETSIIRISFKTLDADTIEIAVCDNGCGMSEDQVDRILDREGSKRENHIGLQNVYTKLQLYYEGRASLRIDSEPGKGTAIIITVPKIREAHENTDC